jgi:hypothetical protein
MYKKAVDTGRSAGGISGDIDYLSCLSRVNPDSGLITYTPADSFDILKEVLERESGDKNNAPFADLLGSIEGMMTASSIESEGPTDEAVVLFPNMANDPFIRSLGERKTLDAPANVAAGYPVYFFYACGSINEAVVEVIPGFAMALEEGDASDRNINEVTGTIAYFQELSPGLLSSLGDEIAVIYRQREAEESETLGILEGKELPERLKPNRDEYIIAFNVADPGGFDRGMSFLDENTPESDVKTAEKGGIIYYSFVTEGETEAVVALKDGWGYGAVEADSLKTFFDRMENGVLADDEDFTEGINRFHPELNALVYLDYSAGFNDKMDDERLSALLRPTMISAVYDGEAIEIDGYPYNFWTYLFSTSYALGSMEAFSLPGETGGE